MDSNMTAFALVLIVAISGMVLVAQNPTGAALQVIEMREYRSFAEGMCPDPQYPVPVFRDQTYSGTGKQTHVDCVAEGTIISASGKTFYPEVNRKREHYAYGSDKLNQL